MIIARFKVTHVVTARGQSHAQLKGEDGFISLHQPATDNLMEGHEFVLQLVESAKEVPVTERDTSRIINLEPVDRFAQAESRKDLL